MNKLLIASALACSLALASGVAAAQDAKKGEAIVKEAGCFTKCHDMDKKKKGPAFKVSAAKFKKEGMDANKIVADIKEAHEDMKLKDDELKNVAAWLLTL